jgi:toxin ParE1/3/4
MKYRAAIRSRAEFDEAEIFEYLSRRSLATAQRFVDKVDETVQGLCSTTTPGMPWMSENPRLRGLRWTKVRGFPNHLLFFRVSDELIEIIRILHGARDIETILDAGPEFD